MAIGRSLMHNTHLMVLDMTRNNIGDLGATGFGDGLAINSKLTTLAIQNNNIEDQGIIGMVHGTWYIIFMYRNKKNTI